MSAPPLPAAGRVRMVLDTDTDNEIDDQYALVYALLSPERLAVEAVYAAPYHNRRSTGPADGMRRSRAEIDRVLDRLALDPRTPVHDGATGWLTGARPVPTEATDDLIARALAPAEGPLYVVAIGAPTNVATALRLEPAIADRIVVVWLGGNPATWPSAREFNLQQDLEASCELFDSGVGLVHVPCINVTEHLRTTRAEIDRYVRPAGAVGRYLAGIFDDQVPDRPGRSKEIWDLGPVAWLVDPSSTSSVCLPSPRPVADGDGIRWEQGGSLPGPGGAGRHEIREITRINRDRVFADLFAKLAAG